MRHHRHLAIALILTALLGGLAIATDRLAGADDAPPRPVLAWPAGSLEVRVAFDAPVGESVVNGLRDQVIRFEGSDPYVADTDGAGAGYSLRIAGVRLADDGRTLILATDPHPMDTTFTLPPALGQTTYTLGGVDAAVYDEGAEVDFDKPTWSVWWPVLDPREVQEATAGSVEHERGFARISDRPGTLALRTLVAQGENQTAMTLRVEADRPFEVSLGFETAESAPGDDGRHQAELTTETFPGAAAELAVRMPVGADGFEEPVPSIDAWRIKDASNEVAPLDPSRLQLVWAPMTPPESADVPAPPYDLEGGDARRGAEVFVSDAGKCATCHQIGGQGGEVGPNLDKLANADPARIYRDIADPSAVIAPEYVTYTVATHDGRVAVGVVRAAGSETLRVLDTDAKETTIDRAEVADLLPSGTSVMPVGLAGALGEGPMRDLIAYLRSPVRPTAADTAPE